MQHQVSMHMQIWAVHLVCPPDEVHAGSDDQEAGDDDYLNEFILRRQQVECISIAKVTQSRTGSQNGKSILSGELTFICLGMNVTSNCMTGAPVCAFSICNMAAGFCYSQASAWPPNFHIVLPHEQAFRPCLSGALALTLARKRLCSTTSV